MRVLVTGGAGFIGSHVADALLGEGHELTVVDDLSSGQLNQVPKGADFHQLDIRTVAFEQLIKKVRPEAVCHLAAQMDVRRSVDDPIYDAETNVIGSVRLARAATEAGCERILFSSTGGAIYGEQERYPASESHPCRPTSPYGVAKRCAELYLEFAQRSGGPMAVILRYSNVYGPRQDPHGEAGVVAIFAGRLLGGERLTIYDDGGQTRDYVYVDDVVRANILGLRCRRGGAYNIGTGLETDVNALAQMMGELAGQASQPEYAPAREGEQRRSSIDPGLAARELGWEPRTGLRTGLAETVRYFRDNMER